MKTIDFDYHLPPELIAQKPLPQRDGGRLLVLDRKNQSITHNHFPDIAGFIHSGDVVVVNDSRVMSARLYGLKAGTGGSVEILLLEQLDPQRWKALVGGRRLNQGVKIQLIDRGKKPTEIFAEITAVLDGPVREILFEPSLAGKLDDLGLTPLPPYISKQLEEPERYQTVYARPLGSSAAPTAGLHFTPEILLSLRDRGVIVETVTLHIGLDTFKPITEELITEHNIHSEWISLKPESAKRINQAKLAGGRIFAVGTTSVRVLETAALRSEGVAGSLKGVSSQDALGNYLEACPWRPVVAVEGKTDLYIYPGYRFRVVDALITNFHLPQSSLILLVSAFDSKERIMEAYKQAIERHYRFFSFGDSMIIV